MQVVQDGLEGLLGAAHLALGETFTCHRAEVDLLEGVAHLGRLDDFNFVFGEFNVVFLVLFEYVRQIAKNADLVYVQMNLFDLLLNLPIGTFLWSFNITLLQSLLKEHLFILLLFYLVDVG